MNVESGVDIGRVEVLPILPSLDFQQTRDFYAGRLGFEVSDKGGEYLVVRRGRLELHFWQCEDPTLCENSSVFFRLDAFHALFDDFRRRGVEPVSGFDADEDDVTRFHIRDPHGNVLLFGRRLRLLA